MLRFHSACNNDFQGRPAGQSPGSPTSSCLSCLLELLTAYVMAHIERMLPVVEE
jgi:hypothetical protein